MDVMVLRKIREKKEVKRGMMTATKYLNPDDIQYLLDNIKSKV